MEVINVIWTATGIILKIKCVDCNVSFLSPSSNSVVICPKCHSKEYWHGFNPKSDNSNDTFNSCIPVMKINLDKPKKN